MPNLKAIHYSDFIKLIKADLEIPLTDSMLGDDKRTIPIVQTLQDKEKFNLLSETEKKRLITFSDLTEQYYNFHYDIEQVDARRKKGALKSLQSDFKKREIYETNPEEELKLSSFVSLLKKYHPNHWVAIINKLDVQLLENMFKTGEQNIKADDIETKKILTFIQLHLHIDSLNNRSVLNPKQMLRLVGISYSTKSKLTPLEKAYKLITEGVPFNKLYENVCKDLDPYCINAMTEKSSKSAKIMSAARAYFELTQKAEAKIENKKS